LTSALKYRRKWQLIGRLRERCSGQYAKSGPEVPGHLRLPKTPQIKPFSLENMRKMYNFNVDL